MNACEKLFAKVSILDCPYSVDRLFDYAVPVHLSDSVAPGVFVLVPFGASNKRVIALVHSICKESTVPKIKAIVEVAASMLPLSDESLKMCEFLKDRCFCSTKTALKAVLPSSVMPEISFRYAAIEKKADISELNDKVKTVYAYILQNEDITDIKLRGEFGDSVDECTKLLQKLGLIEKLIKNSKPKDKLEKYVSLIRDDAGTEEKLITGGWGISPKQKLLADCLEQYGELSQSDILSRLPITSAVITAMEKKGLIKVEKHPVMRNPFSELYDEVTSVPNVELSEEQKTAYKKLDDIYSLHEAKAALLFGITGSGKTMVMKKLIDRVISDGRKVIMLLPEIALTPQAVKIFITFYGKRVAVFHSGLSVGERHDAWKAVREGDIDLVIGTRSAIFAPIEKLGLIIIDEEQESSYKSDISPKYHAKDVAGFRCAYNNAMLLLASATPSVESYYKAQTGVYSLVKLTKRYGSAVLPDTMIADMRFMGSDTAQMLSKQLVSELSARLERHEKSVLFLNRRGYHIYMSCRNCGETVMCPNCSVSLTLHRKKSKNGNTNDRLVCHYCGYSMVPPQKCPSCNGETMRYFGLGTQKIEDEIEAVFPNAHTVRMDADTTSGKMAHQKIIDEFSKDDSDILVGTQMVTKGHDFKGVTLVGILSADMSLHSDDFRANERTFSLVTQCAGRAGRTGKKGLAIIQTYSPNHPVILAAAAQDYEKFYKDEIALRKETVYPPFCDFAVINIHSYNEHELMLSAGVLKEIIEQVRKEFSEVSVIVYGPFEAGIYKLNNSFRMKTVIKCKNNKKTRLMLAEILKRFLKSATENVNAGIDINPSNI